MANKGGPRMVATNGGGMTLQERVEMARTAIQRIFNGPGTNAEKREALYGLAEDLKVYIDALPVETMASWLRQDIDRERRK